MSTMTSLDEQDSWLIEVSNSEITPALRTKLEMTPRASWDTRWWVVDSRAISERNASLLLECPFEEWVPMEPLPLEQAIEVTEKLRASVNVMCHAHWQLKHAVTGEVIPLEAISA